ncbi:MAG TPA: TetR/AcrR family transcriptional regulator [Gemmatimonadaceae bacterium]|nr:TetR/AcrR family transcriptional regulator [Gemmatimonadaceae bacterium]
MFETRTAKGEATRARILETALALFRARGFDATTMRDIAAEAGMSLGAAYHYFPSKDAIVIAYYDLVQDEHARRVHEALPAEKTLRGRLRAAFHAKLDVLAGDRRLMGALLRYTGDPDSPLSFLGEGTRALQYRSMAVFADALEGEALPRDVRGFAPVVLWALHMGLLLYFLYDRSPDQVRTRRLTDGAVELFVRSLPLIKLGVLRSMRRRLLGLLDEAEIIPPEADIERHRWAQTGGTDDAVAAGEPTDDTDADAKEPDDV